MSTIFWLVLLLLATIASAFAWRACARSKSDRKATLESLQENKKADKAKKTTAERTTIPPRRDLDDDDDDNYYRGRPASSSTNTAAIQEAEKAYGSAQLMSLIAGSITVGFGAFFLIVLIFSSYVAVGTRAVGIVTSFNKPVGTLDSGLHLILPWQQVHELDGAVTTNSHVGDGCNDIRIANNTIACVDNTVAWRIKLDHADSLYQDYRTFENIQENLVTREKNAALNEVFGKLNPLAPIDPNNPTVVQANAGIDFAKLGEEVTAILQQKVGDKIEVQKVVIPLVRFDGTTQQNLDNLNNQAALTRIANERKNTSAAEAAANDQLAASLNSNPQVLVNKCLDIVAGGKVTLPPGFNCLGSETPVTIPAR